MRKVAINGFGRIGRIAAVQVSMHDICDVTKLEEMIEPVSLNYQRSEDWHDYSTPPQVKILERPIRETSPREFGMYYIGSGKARNKRRK